MSYKYATNSQIKEYMQIVRDNDLWDYADSVSAMRGWSTTMIESEIELLEEVAMEKEALAAAYFNEF